MQQNNTRQKGFSLIELMIVVLIIGIGASMAVLYIDNSEARLKSESRRLFAMVQLARDDALIKGQSLGLVVNKTDYYFTRLENGKWLQLREKPYRIFKLSDDIQLRVIIAGRASDKDKPVQAVSFEHSIENRELIYFLATGETSEFQIWISNNKDLEYILSSTFFGELSLKKSEAI